MPVIQAELKSIIFKWDSKEVSEEAEWRLSLTEFQTYGTVTEKAHVAK